MSSANPSDRASLFNVAMNRVAWAVVLACAGAASCGSGENATPTATEGGLADALAPDAPTTQEGSTAASDSTLDALAEMRANEDAAVEASGDSGHPWLLDAAIVARGSGVTNMDCRGAAACPHNQDTDLARFAGSDFLAYRHALSSIRGPNSAIVIATSSDAAAFATVAVLPAPNDRDIRAPHFFQAGGKLCIMAVTRLPVSSLRDANVDAVTDVTCSSDGSTWGPLLPIVASGWSLWRPELHAGTYYAAGTIDGDSRVALFSSADGVSWTQGSDIYAVAADTPTEAELVFLPSGRLLALVRLDGTDAELDGSMGRLRTKLCWADTPYTSFSCPSELSGARLDGPIAFLSANRLFVIARKHLQPSLRKRTALYELTGDFAGDALGLKERGELPSAGDTSYAGALPLDDGRWLISWYSGDVAKDEAADVGQASSTDVWKGVLDVLAIGDANDQ
jgi:hypothetical protein